MICGNQQTISSKIQVVNLHMDKFHSICLISVLESPRDTKTSKHSVTYLKDQMEIFIIILSLMQEHTELNFQMSCIITYREKLHGKLSLESDYLKDGHN